MPSPNPRGHLAVLLVRDLVALLDRHPASKQYVRLVAGGADLERRGRKIAETRPDRPVNRPRDEDLSFCGLCGTYHANADADPACGVTS